MYSEKDLELVSSSIPIYTKALLKTKTKKPKRGHFTCNGCDASRLSGSKAYITALVYDFDRLGPCFAFLYSRGDVHYHTPTTDRLTALLTNTINFDWIYRDKQRTRESLIHVRGWWNVMTDQKFKHRNGVINLGDHVNFDDPDTDNGEIVNPEFGIKLFIAPYAGMYRDYKDLDQINNWDEEMTYNNTFVHPSTDRLANIAHPKWSRYGEKKPQTRRTRRNMTARQRERANEEITQNDAEIRRRQAMEAIARTERPRRTTRGAVRAPTLAPGEGRTINFNMTDAGIPPEVAARPEGEDHIPDAGADTF